MDKLQILLFALALFEIDNVSSFVIRSKSNNIFSFGGCRYEKLHHSRIVVNINDDDQCIVPPFNSITTKSTTSLNYSSSEEQDYDKEDDFNLTLQEACQVVSYRLILLIISIASGLNLVSENLQGSGLSMNTLSDLQQISMNIFGWGLLIALIIIPQNRRINTKVNYDDDDNNDDDNNDDDDDYNNNNYSSNNDTSIAVKFNSILPKLSAMAIIFIKIPYVLLLISNDTTATTATSGIINEAMVTTIVESNANKSINIVDNIINQAFITFICSREIGYYGAQYKVEAIIAIATIILSSLMRIMSSGSSGMEVLLLPDVLTSSILALCLLVLSFGKIFEPLKDDVEPNGSSFFLDK